MWQDFHANRFPLQGNGKVSRTPWGTVFGVCVAYIQEAKPKAFILENVKGLLKMYGGDVFQSVVQNMRNVVRPRCYRVIYKLMNTAHHGILHNRP